MCLINALISRLLLQFIVVAISRVGLVNTVLFTNHFNSKYFIPVSHTAVKFQILLSLTEADTHKPIIRNQRLAMF